MHGQSQAGEVVSLADLARQLQHADEMRRHELRVSYPVPFDCAQRGLGVEAWHEHGCITVRLGRHRPSQRGRMVQRRWTQVDRVAVEAEELAHQLLER